MMFGSNTTVAVQARTPFPVNLCPKLFCSPDALLLTPCHGLTGTLEESVTL